MRDSVLVRPRTISDEQILETAKRCFLEHGPSVSTDAIAAELGVSGQALLKRFHNKQELMIAAVGPCTAKTWTDLVERGPDDRPFEIQLREILDELAIFFVDVVKRMNVLRWSGVDMHKLMSQFDEPPPVRDLRVLSAYLKRAAAKGLIRAVDYSATAMLILTSMHGPAMLTEILGSSPTGQTQNEYISHFIDTLLHGLIDHSSSEQDT
ncbi:Bacterial regulatory proteins, tetR family [Thalassoglobus neptunius]|uniref:Bacterial regulatory proteins, tetR family n=1 Tax=Thalassoglobus neptunius TaxID=1938619 RepID=A0A5C5VQ53_9PLAN|nr:Bacterial regulatory proteins, tetR family [Thalassoglobus neptunius]